MSKEDPNCPQYCRQRAALPSENQTTFQYASNTKTRGFNYFNAQIGSNLEADAVTFGLRLFISPATSL